MPAPQNRSHTTEDLNDGILSYHKHYIQ